MFKQWDLSDIGDLTGSVALVTGANRGLGFASALELARNGAVVVLACRSLETAGEAASRIRSEVPGAQLDAVELDLADAGTGQAECVDRLTERHSRLDILLNNAGLVNLTSIERNSAGIEMQMAVNHFGHFALSGALIGLLKATPGARVATLSSISYRHGGLDLDDLGWNNREFDRTKVYGASKLANLLFMTELQRRISESGLHMTSVAAHPGLTGTERQQSEGIGGRLTRMIAAPVKAGVRPQLFAATSPTLHGGELIGPKHGLRGRPVSVEIKPPLDADTAARLWEISQEITGLELL